MREKLIGNLFEMMDRLSRGIKMEILLITLVGLTLTSVLKRPVRILVLPNLVQHAITPVLVTRVTAILLMLIH